MNTAQTHSRFSWMLGAVVAPLLLVSAGIPLSAHAYFSGAADASGGTLTAGSLNIARKGFSALTTSVSSSTNGTAAFTISSTGTIAPQYRLTAQKGVCSPAFYNGLSVSVVMGSSVYSGSMQSLVATTSTTGSWSFAISAGSAIALPGDTCDIELQMEAWQPGFAASSEGGFAKEISIPLTVQASGHLGRTVVLNEVLPRPDSSAPAPANQEFIELFNTSGVPVDVAGWTVSEVSGTTEKSHVIVSSVAATGELEPYGGTTLLAPNTPVAFVFGGSKTYLNNDGDTIRLYDSAGVLRDEFTYTSSTEGDSYQRIPDGTGSWVDPVPTPGRPNVDAPLPPEAASTEIPQNDTVVEPLASTTVAATSSEDAGGAPDAASTTPVVVETKTVEGAPSSTPSVPEAPADASSTESVAPQTLSQSQSSTPGTQESSSAPPADAPPPMPVIADAVVLPPTENSTPVSAAAAASTTP